MCCRTVTRFGCFLIKILPLPYTHTHTHKSVCFHFSDTGISSFSFFYQCKNRITIFCSFVVLFLIDAKKMHEFILTHSRCPQFFFSLLECIILNILILKQFIFRACSSRCMRASSFLSSSFFAPILEENDIYVLCSLNFYEIMNQISHKKEIKLIS